MPKLTVAQEVIEQKIYLIRGQRVMIDRDLAKLYCIPTKRLKEQVKRNTKRFPNDFMFQLTKEEFGYWRSQFATSNSDKLGLRHSPYVFTEQGVAMLSSVLNSERAIEVNIAIMRAFVKLRQILSTNKALASKLKELEQRLEKHDTEIHAIFDAIRQLMTPPDKPKRKIGFHIE
jgi:hypothetical protein